MNARMGVPGDQMPWDKNGGRNALSTVVPHGKDVDNGEMKQEGQS
jgi:hypothetical protein